jgi:glycosyltransferase involved in cell wall biosynthesis
MKICILLPYKENFSSEYAGAVSIFIKDTILKSKYKEQTTVYGLTKFKQNFLKKYKNLSLDNKSFFQSSSNIYVQNFIKNKEVCNSDIIEIHNRPNYVKKILSIKKPKKILFFHNDPLNMNGSKSIKERLYLIKNLDKILFNSEWCKERFIENIPKIFHKIDKLDVVYQSTNKINVDIKKKKKIISFVGKLNHAKGYDLFAEAIVKILNKFPKWSANVVGDESREKIIVDHPRINHLGFQTHKKVLEIFKKTSISVVCSRWNEPFGRTSLEASSRGCAVIISNRGGLPETTSDALILKELTVTNLYKSIEKLILNNKLRINLQKKTLDNFYLTNTFISKKIDLIRTRLFSDLKSENNQKNIKILHITNFNERHNGRLFYNTGRRINNGFVRLNHSVLTISDRDIISYHRSLKDIDGSKKLNFKLLETISNYVPNLIVFGHADLIHIDTLKFIKTYYPKIKMAQWFLDKMDSSWIKNKKRFIDKINLMNCSFCTSSPNELKFKRSSKIYYIPNPADVSFETLECYKNNNPINDLFFAMSHGVHRGILKKGKFDKRALFVQELKNKNPNIKFDLYGLDNKQPIWSDDYKIALNKSKMALNLSQGKPSKFYSSDRIAQLVANGILTFVDASTKLQKLFKKDEVVFYNSLNDLSNKIDIYLNNKTLRNKIAKCGKKKYLKHLNSTKVASFIVNKSMNFTNKKKFIWE